MKKILTALFPRISSAFGFWRWIGKPRRKTKQHRMAVLFNRLVVQNKLLVEYSEIINGLLIALDRKNKKLLVIEQNKNSGRQHCVPLATVSTALVVRERSENGNVQKIFLVLKQKQSGKTIRLCFFDGAYNSAAEVLCLLRRALHWKSRVELYKQPDFTAVQKAYSL